MSKNQSESSDNEFVYSLYLTPFINTHNNGRLQWHVALKRLPNFCDKDAFVIIFKASDGKLILLTKKNEKREAWFERMAEVSAAVNTIY